MGCYIWYSEDGPGRAAAPPTPLLAVSNVTAHPSTASVPITVLLYDGPLLCSFNVAIKGLITKPYYELRYGNVIGGLQRNTELIELWPRRQHCGGCSLGKITLRWPWLITLDRSIDMLWCRRCRHSSRKPQERTSPALQLVLLQATAAARSTPDWSTERQRRWKRLRRCWSVRSSSEPVVDRIASHAFSVSRKLPW